MKTKKRTPMFIVGVMFLLASIFGLTLSAGTAMADTPDRGEPHINIISYDNELTKDIYTAEGTASNTAGTATYDADNNRLILNGLNNILGVQIQDGYNMGEFAGAFGQGLEIKLEGTNNIGYMGIYSEASLIFSGDGTINLFDTGYGEYARVLAEQIQQECPGGGCGFADPEAIFSYGAITVNSGNINITRSEASNSVINSVEGFTINGGTINIVDESGEVGINSQGPISFLGGSTSIVTSNQPAVLIYDYADHTAQIVLGDNMQISEDVEIVTQSSRPCYEEDCYDYSETFLAKSGAVAGGNDYYADTIHIVPKETGENQYSGLVTWTQGKQRTSGSGEDIIVKTDYPLDLLTDITLDGESLSEDYYDVVSGSTILTIHGDFVDTLDDGEHTISFIYGDDNTINTKFTIGAGGVEEEEIEVSNTAADDEATTPYTGTFSKIEGGAVLSLIGCIVTGILVAFIAMPKIRKHLK